MIKVLHFISFPISCRNKDQYKQKIRFRKIFHPEPDRSIEYNSSAFFPGDEYVIKDEKKALELLKKAAHKNHALSYYMLFKCYYFGIGACKNDSLAVKYLQKAAALGEKNAKRVLKKIQNIEK